MTYIQRFRKGILDIQSNVDQKISVILDDENISVGVAISLIAKKRMKLLYLNHTDVAEYLNLSESTWRKCRRKQNPRKLNIWEVIIFAVIMELDFMNSVKLLKRFNYSLSPEKYTCDRYVYRLLAVKHKNTYEMNERLELLNFIKNSFYKPPNEFSDEFKKYLEN